MACVRASAAVEVRERGRTGGERQVPDARCGMGKEWARLVGRRWFCWDGWRFLRRTPRSINPCELWHPPRHWGFTGSPCDSLGQSRCGFLHGATALVFSKAGPDEPVWENVLHLTGRRSGTVSPRGPLRGHTPTPTPMKTDPHTPSVPAPVNPPGKARRKAKARRRGKQGGDWQGSLPARPPADLPIPFLLLGGPSARGRDRRGGGQRPVGGHRPGTGPHGQGDHPPLRPDHRGGGWE